MVYKKIAILRVNALGDFIFLLPAIRALKETYPTAELVLLGHQWHKEFLASHPVGVDRVEVVPPIEGVGALKTTSDTALIDDFFITMRQEHFDLALQVHGGGRYSNPFVKQLAAKQTAGLKAADAESLDISIPYIYYQNEYLRYLEVAYAVGARTFRIEPSLFPSDNDRQKAYTAVSGFEEPYVVIHPGASDLRRRWPVEQFATVADWLASREFRVFITGTEAEKELTQGVLKLMSQPATDLAGTIDLNTLVGVIAEARMVVSNDTGPFHLAYALKTPAVGLFWAGNVVNAGPLTRRLARPLLSWQVICPLCKQPITQHPFDPEDECDHAVSFVSSIEEGVVILEAEQLLTEPLGERS